MVDVLILDPVHPDGPALLEAAGHKVIHLPDADAHDLEAAIASAEALILRGRHLPDAVWDAASCLRLVSRHGVGCDNVDLERMRRIGATVAISADANAVSVAEHAMTLALSACKRLPDAIAAAKMGNWARRETMGARDMAGASVLVVGFGRIGRAFAERARAFGGSVSVHDPALPTSATLPDKMVLADDLATALGAAEIVSLHLPAADTTRGLFDAAMLDRLAPGTILVNTARGGIVDETALRARLDADPDLLYATDVLTREPPNRDDPMLFHPRVIVTPHSAAMTTQGARRMSVGAAENIIAFFEGHLPDRMTAFAPGLKNST